MYKKELKEILDLLMEVYEKTEETVWINVERHFFTVSYQEDEEDQEKTKVVFMLKGIQDAEEAEKNIRFILDYLKNCLKKQQTSSKDRKENN